MPYIPPRADLAEVDPRFAELDAARQARVVEVLLTVATLPMALAVDAVLAADQLEEYSQYAETKQPPRRAPAHADAL